MLRAVTITFVLSLGALFPVRGMAADPSLIERGAYLARAGDCEACHTAPGGKPFAGGAAIASPFGPIYAPNITPDKLNGIGAWSDDEFYRAMHEGIGKGDRHLYPAFPYIWYTKITRDDVQALRAYLNSLEPVAQPSKPTRLSFPFDIRMGIAAWNKLYFREGESQPRADKSSEWNRGAYLVEGLGHCADCHTPKGVAMAPDDTREFAGGRVDDWYAPNITSDETRGIGRWSDQDLFSYLKLGTAPGKGSVAGPMSQVVHDSLAYLTDADLRAIISYLRDVKPIADYVPHPVAADHGPHAAGEGIYLDRCASCHQLDGKGIPGKVPPLAGSDLVTAKGPDDVIRVILAGRPAVGSLAPMPAPGPTMSDDQIAAVTNYVRNAWTNAAPGMAGAGLVATIREKTSATLYGLSDRVSNTDPCSGGEYDTIVPLPDPAGRINQALDRMTDATMLDTIPQLIQDAREANRNISQSEIVNGLTMALCRLEKGKGKLKTPTERVRVGQFALLVFSQLTPDDDKR